MYYRRDDFCGRGSSESPVHLVNSASSIGEHIFRCQAFFFPCLLPRPFSFGNRGGRSEGPRPEAVARVEGSQNSIALRSEHSLLRPVRRNLSMGL